MCLGRSLLHPFMTVDTSQLNFPVGRMRRDEEEGQREKLVHHDGNSLREGRSRTSLWKEEEGGKNSAASITASLHTGWHRSSPEPGNTIQADMDADKSSSEKLVLEFKEDTELTEVRFSLSDSFSKNYSKISSLEATDVCKTFILQTKKHFLDFHLMQLWRFRFSIESFPWYTAKTLNLFYFILFFCPTTCENILVHFK